MLGPYGPRGQKTNGVAGHNTGGLSYNAANILVPNDGPVRAGARSRCDLTMLRDRTHEYGASASAIHWHRDSVTVFRVGQASRPGERELKAEVRRSFITRPRLFGNNVLITMVNTHETSTGLDNTHDVGPGGRWALLCRPGPSL